MGPQLRIVGSLLALALVVGGAGLDYPMLEMVLNCSALIAAGWLLWHLPRARLSPLLIAAFTLLAIILLIPLVQLIPLPSAMWSALPGRSSAVVTDRLLGWQMWRPITLDVEGTVRSFLAMLPAVAIFISAALLPARHRSKLLWMVVAFALGNAVLGIVQFSTGGAFTPFPSAHLGYPIGLFVNRNHNAVLLLAAMPVVAALGAELRPNRALMAAITIGVLLVLAIVIIATTSRMAMLLLPLAAGASLLVLVSGQSLLRFALPVVVAFGGGIVAVFVGGGFERTLTRFSSLHDARFDYWSDISWALEQYRLAGTGLGTFARVYGTAESLDGVSDTYLRHAHNDYLELVLETGWVSILVLLLLFCLFGWVITRLLRSPQSPTRVREVAAASVSIVLILLFSLVDYPLRMPAISGIFALFAAILLPSARALTSTANAAVGHSWRGHFRWRHVVQGGTTLLLAILFVLVVQAGISAHDLIADDPSAAAAIAPWSTRAWEDKATEALIEHHDDTAMRSARTALRLSPISVPGIRTLGLLQIESGSPARGTALMGVAATLGWRDTLTQIWAIDAAGTREPAKAVERAEALFRTGAFLQPAILVLLRNQSMRILLAERLEQKPDWRWGFFKTAEQLAPQAGAAYEELVARLMPTRAPVTTTEAEPMITALVDARQDEQAARIWQLVRRSKLIANGDFEQVISSSEKSEPSAWDVLDDAQSPVEVVRPSFDSSGKALKIRATDGSGEVLSQQLMLDPGDYVLAFRVHVDGDGDPGLRWQLECHESDETQQASIQPRRGVGWQVIKISLTVPIQDCRIQRLALRLQAVTDPPAIWLDNVQVNRSR